MTVETVETRAATPADSAVHPPLSHRFASWWATLDQVARGRSVPGTVTVAIVGALAVFVAGLWFASTSANLAYEDAISHLTIARRIFDSKAPGFEQLGTVWLPMPHLLLMPFVSNLWLWSTGWGAILLGMIAMAGTCAGIYRLLARLGVGRAGRLTAVLLIVLNPNALYMYTTALTEPVLIMGLCGAFAGLANWTTSGRRLSAGELAVFAGVPAAVAVLSRYEGWALVAAGSALVGIVSWRRDRQFGRAVKNMLAFAAVPAAGMAWWLSYNWVIYQNPLEFWNGRYSASSLQQELVDRGLVPTKGNLGLTFATFDASVVQTVGVLAVALAAVGLVHRVFRGGLSDRSLLAYLTLLPYVFSIVSLYVGQSVMHNANTVPVGWWNNRYSLAVIVPAVVFAGLAVQALLRGTKWSPIAILTVGTLAVGQAAWFLAAPSERSAVLAEMESQQTTQEPAWEAARWLGAHYRGGGILIDESAGGNAILPIIGLPLAEYYNRSTGPLFEQALARPQQYAKWIVVRLGAETRVDGAPQDLVLERLITRPEILANYAVAYRTETTVVYERIDR